MASLFICDEPNIHILDAGAGVGSLFAALVEILCQREVKPQSIRVTAYEIDELMIRSLSEVMMLCQSACEHVEIAFSGEIISQDFIEQGAALLEGNLFSPAAHLDFTCAILNPPYRKLHTQSEERKLLSRGGIEASNLYTGFFALATRLLPQGGEVVAITPRSFCNGPYFKKFRQTFVETMTVRQIHLFETRTHVFQDNDVLQENIVVHALKGVEKQNVTITSSVGTDDEYTSIRTVNYNSVINPKDTEAFIHIVPDDWGQQVIEQLSHFHCSLESLGLSVSTGRVVDFRAIEFLRKLPEAGTAPLLFPTHLTNGAISWPKIDAKKPNALAITDASMSLLVSNEHYVLVKRFSAKEEKRRVVAVAYDANQLAGAWVGFENHLNYFHQQGHGLSLKLARGLAAYLNSTLVDAYFRQFNGHTQVNATDLRKLPYPSLMQLEALGDSIAAENLSQHELDKIVKEVLLGMDDAPNNAQQRDPIQMKTRIEEALSILKVIGLPRAQHNERSALTLLALLNLQPAMAWSQASDPLCGITPMMEFFNQHYGKNYAPNTRETVRRQTVHQFLEAGLIEANPDQPDRPINSPKAVYRIEQGALELLRTFGTPEWEQNLNAYKSMQDVA